jgi:hypothetical protein
MSLGDFREAGGGQVFKDAGAVVSSEGSVPLIVTLPKGRVVPVTIINGQQ